MNDAGVAKRYAQALFMLADESQNVDKIGQDLAYACETIDGNAELKQAYTGVQFSMAGKKNAIAKVFQDQVDKIVVNFLQVLIEKGRTGYLSDIQKAYAKLLDDRNGIADATVTSAFPLKEEEAKNIALAITGCRCASEIRR